MLMGWNLPSLHFLACDFHYTAFVFQCSNNLAVLRLGFAFIFIVKEYAFLGQTSHIISLLIGFSLN